MSGHNKWSTIKHKKAAKDAKRGAIFTRIIKDIQVAARMGGSDINANPRLRIAVQKAKVQNMPSDNIERAIKKGAGELEGVSYQEYIYEGYGPGGVAFMVDVLSENRNRSAAEVRTVFSKNGGSMAESGSVAYLFDRKGVIEVERSAVAEDVLMEIVLEAGAEDMSTDDPDVYEIIVTPENLMKVVGDLEKAGISTSEAELRYIPKSEITVNEKVAEQNLNIMEKLEDLDDVQNVYANFEVPDEVMANLGK